MWLGHQSGRLSVYKIVHLPGGEAAAEFSLQFETRLYGHMATITGLVLSPESREAVSST